MPYAPAAATVMRKRHARQRNWKCANCRGVWHTPCTQPPAPHRKPLSQHSKSAQLRAYGIRPSRRRMSRTAYLYHSIANPRNSGRMPYAPTAAAVMRKRHARQRNWKCANCRGVWHTPFTPPHDPHRISPPRHCQPAQFRAYAIRPYGGEVYKSVGIAAEDANVIKCKPKLPKQSGTCKKVCVW